MNLLDDFHSVLTGVKDLAVSGEFKAAVQRDLTALENAASNGIDAVQRHVAGWFGAVYGTDPGTGASPVQPGAGVVDTGTTVAAAPPPDTLPPATVLEPSGQDPLPGT